MIRVVNSRNGEAYYVPFNTEYPPSYWLLLQQCSVCTAIPENYIALHFTCDGIREVLSISSDADVLGIAELFLSANPTIHVSNMSI
jgi:hypothetical protein